MTIAEMKSCYPNGTFEGDKIIVTPSGESDFTIYPLGEKQIALTAEQFNAVLEGSRRWNADKTGLDDQIYPKFVESEEAIVARRHAELKAELEKIKEDIEQEVFGIVRDDFAEKKARAAEIVNELRVLEGKEPREVKV